MNEHQFQTPKDVCEYMASFVPVTVPASTVLEPTPGKGNLVWALTKRTPFVLAPKDFSTVSESSRFDYIVMNPPFTPMKLGYDILYRCMTMSDRIVALMPWLTIINSSRRLDKIRSFGLRRVIHLPRNVFPGSRVQTCILVMDKFYKDDTKFLFYERAKSA